MFTQDDALVAANKFFPNNYGVLVSGSQQQNYIFKKETDIDIVILDTLSSSKWSFIAEKDGYTIDFSVLPIADIDNILDNELYDSKNVLLSLTQGKPLSDPFDVIGRMQQKAAIYLDTVQFKTHVEYERYLIELMKLRKLFTQPLLHQEMMIVLCDFVSFITILETIRITKWSSKTKHKLRSLEAFSPGFILKIAKLFNKGIEGQFNEIIAFIDHYHNSYAVSYLAEPEKYKKLVINISYLNFSISKFTSEILPKIITQDTKDFYKYFYLSPKKYTRKYKHDISLVFIMNNENEYLTLLGRIENNLMQIETPRLHFNNFCEAQLATPFENLNIEINALVIGHIKAFNDFEPNKINEFFFRLCFYSKRILGISNQEFQNVNSFISQKWLLTNTEQFDANGYPGILKLRQEKLSKAEMHFKDIFPRLLQLLITENDKDSEKEILLNNVLEAIQKIERKFDDLVIPENDINEAIFVVFNFTNIKGIWVYKLIIEALLKILNIIDADKFNALYACSKAVNEVGFETTKQRLN